jgi:hypothetical protein
MTAAASIKLSQEAFRLLYLLDTFEEGEQILVGYGI